ncbi:MAG: hypothetical protein H6908_02010 [Hyphomicrobiales bacterium]|nr:hypothetical protein [Rickettsiales bacterium]MCP5361407.1 hypothetical protein [Hyphomicrobiales bacterium]
MTRTQLTFTLSALWLGILLAATPAHAIAFIWLADPGFVKYAFVKIPFIAACLLALAGTFLLARTLDMLSHLRRFFTLLAGATAGMVLGVILFYILIFAVGKPMVKGPPIIGWIAYWYFPLVLSHSLVTMLRWAIKRLGKQDPAPLKKPLWLLASVTSFSLFGFYWWEFFR